MDLNSNFAAIIGLPVQLVSIMMINFYWLDYKMSKRDILTISLLIFLPSIVLFTFFGTLAVIYLLGSLLFFLYKKYSNKIYVLHVLFSFIFAVITDHLASVVSLKWFGNIQSELAFVLFRNVLFCVFLIIIAYIYKRVLIRLFQQYKIGKHSLLLLIGLVLLTLTFFYYNILTNKTSITTIGANLLIFIVYLFVITLIAVSILFVSFQQYKVRQKEKEQENFANYVQVLEDVNSNMQSFKHDYINILYSLRYYIDKRDMDGMTSYFYENILPAHEREIHKDRMLGTLRNLQIKGLKGLLTTKIEQARQQDIPVHVEVTDVISDIPMNIIDLSRMMGILLDNAIEASISMEDPAIRIAFIVLEDSHIIIVQNNIRPDNGLKADEIYQEGFSTKGKQRGIGLSNLQKIVDANTNISLNTQISTDTFIQELEIRL